MKLAAFTLISLIIFSCNKKNEEVFIPYSEASYKVIITMNWAMPKFGVPEGAHFTEVIGMVHSNDTFLWKQSRFATPGLEDVAEIGSITKMNAELDAVILKNKTLSKFTISRPPIGGTTKTDLIFNTNYPNISFASMVAPSPDWFMGITDLSLFNNNTWTTDTTINLMAYDAGTENGDVFGYDNPETMPQQNIGLLTAANASVLANGNTSIAPIGTVRFIKN